MPKNTGLTERCLTVPGNPVRPCDASHMIAAMGIRGGDFTTHYQGFHTRSGEWLEVRWTADIMTGAVQYVYEDTRGLNRR